MQVINEKIYTDATPRKTGYYWCFNVDYPLPQVFFLQWCLKDGVWKLYAGGGYSQGSPWTTGTYRSIKPLAFPPVYTNVSSDENAFSLAGAL